MQATDRKEKEALDIREEGRRMQEQCQEIVKKMRSERDTKIQECEELRAQVKYNQCKIL